VACGRRYTVNDLFARLRRLTRSRLSAVHAAPRPGDIRHSHADISKARELLGYKPRVSFEEGLRKTVDWFTRHHRGAG